MKLARTSFALGAALCATSAFARAGELPSRVDVRADRVAFYPYQNQTLLAAEGHVVVRAGPRTISGDALRYDVIASRLVVTGDVRVTHGTASLDAAAYALDLPSGDATVLRIDDVPATYAVHDDEMATAREEPTPKDAFAELDIDGAKPYIRSRHAIVTPGAGVRMSPADFPTPAGPAIRLPTFLYTIVQNSNIAQTSLPGSTFDQPFNLAGSPGSLLAAHFRYDSTYGPTIGVDERLVNRQKSYAVVSLLPFRNRRIDGIAFERIRPGLQQSLGFSHSIGQFTYTSATYRLQNTGRTNTVTFLADLGGTGNDLGFDVSTLTHDVGHYFGYQAHAGYSYNHSLYGYPFANDFRKTLGGFVYAPSFSYKGTSFDERYDYTYSAYDYPHQLSTATATLNLGHEFHRVRVNGTFSIAQVDDRFRSASVTQTALGLPDPTTTYTAPDGTYYPGYFAYAGLSTFRSYALSAVFAGRGDNRTQFTLVHDRDFPQFHGQGRPPLTATLDLTRRISQQVRIELARSYTFGWGGRYLSPQYSFSISP